MKPLTKTLLGITSFFSSIASWHAVMPLSICWLTEVQIVACVFCGLAAVVAAVITYAEDKFQRP